MTTDIARMDTAAIATLNGASDALARLGEWVQAARHATELVAPLIDTPFVPAAYQVKVDPRATDKEKQAARGLAIANATAAVLQGITLGVDPLVALQQIYIVHGRPGMYAKFMVALVQSRGHEVWTEDLSDTRAIVCGRRKGSEHTERIVITMDMARKAKWTTNTKYTETPQDMLWARAAGRVCDRIASDVLKGIASVEEIQDSIQTTAEVGTRTVTPRRSTAAAMAAKEASSPIGRRAAPPAVEATVEEPPLEETPAPAPLTSPSDPARTLGQPGTTAPPDSNVAAQGQDRMYGPTDAEAGRPIPAITAAQQRKLHALFRENDLADRDAGLLYIAAVIGHPIESTKELTIEEAGAVIDSLETTEAEPTLDVEP